MYRSYHRIKHECAGHTTGLNTSVHVISQDQTRVYRSYHRTEHECADQITGPNTSVVQVRSQDDQTRVCRSHHRTKHECAGQITGPNTSVQVTPQDKTRVCWPTDLRDICCVGRLLAATRSSYSSTPSRTLSMKRVVGNPDAHSNLCRLANFAACSFSCRSV